VISFRSTKEAHCEYGNCGRFIVASRVKSIRSKELLTQNEFADACSLNRSYLANIERCNRNFGIDTLSHIVEGLGMTFAEFFSDD